MCSQPSDCYCWLWWRYLAVVSPAVLWYYLQPQLLLLCVVIIWIDSGCCCPHCCWPIDCIVSLLSLVIVLLYYSCAPWIALWLFIVLYPIYCVTLDFPIYSYCMWFYLIVQLLCITPFTVFDPWPVYLLLLCAVVLCVGLYWISLLCLFPFIVIVCDLGCMTLQLLTVWLFCIKHCWIVFIIYSCIYLYLFIVIAFLQLVIAHIVIPYWIYVVIAFPCTVVFGLHLFITLLLDWIVVLYIPCYLYIILFPLDYCIPLFVIVGLHCYLLPSHLFIVDSYWHCIIVVLWPLLLYCSSWIL